MSHDTSTDQEQAQGRADNSEKAGSHGAGRKDRRQAVLEEAPEDFATNDLQIRWPSRLETSSEEMLGSDRAWSMYSLACAAVDDRTELQILSGAG